MAQRRWSQAAGQHSHALSLESGVFCQDDPQQIARSLWRSAEQSRHKKRTAYGSAMAMLCFFINRAGCKLSAERRDVLEQAKDELRRLRQQHPS